MQFWCDKQLSVHLWFIVFQASTKSAAVVPGHIAIQLTRLQLKSPYQVKTLKSCCSLHAVLLYLSALGMELSLAAGANR